MENGDLLRLRRRFCRAAIPHEERRERERESLANTFIYLGILKLKEGQKEEEEERAMEDIRSFSSNLQM